MFFNPDSVELEGSTNYLLNSLKMFFIVLFWIFRLHQITIKNSKVPRHEKRLRTTCLEFSFRWAIKWVNVLKLDRNTKNCSLSEGVSFLDTFCREKKSRSQSCKTQKFVNLNVQKTQDFLTLSDIKKQECIINQLAYHRKIKEQIM